MSVIFPNKKKLEPSTFNLNEFRNLLETSRSDKKRFWHDYYKYMKTGKEMIAYVRMLKTENRVLKKQLAAIRREVRMGKIKPVPRMVVMPANALYPKKYINIGCGENEKGAIIQTDLYWTRVT